MADAPDVDTLFPAKTPDVDELFPAHVERARSRESLGASPIQDILFGNSDVSPVARVLNHFGQGFKHGWGSDPIGLSDESNEYLKKSGMFNDYVEGHTSITKSANEALIRPAAVALDSAWRGMTGAFVGAQEVVAGVGRDVENSEGTKVKVGDYTATREPIAKQIGLGKLARDVAAMPEAFMGSPHPLGIPPVNLAKAKSLGVIGEGEAGWKGTKEVVPDNLVAEAETAKFDRPAETEPVSGQPAEPVPQLGTPAPETPDVHAVARSIDPETFTKYDALQTRQETFRRWISELRETRDQEAAANAPHAKEIQDTIAKINDPDVTPRLRKKYQARLDDMSEEYQAHIDDATAKDSPDMAKIRTRLQENDYAMRDLATNVGKAYQEARSRFPEPEAVEVKPVEPMAATQGPSPAGTPLEPALPQSAEAPIVQFRKDAVTIEQSLPSALEGYVRLWRANKRGQSGTAFTNDLAGIALPFRKAYGGNLVHVDVPASELSKYENTSGTARNAEFNLPHEYASSALPIEVPASKPTLAPIKPIIDDVAQKLVAAGRPADEAQAAAQIISEYWKTRAERFKGAKGTAEELYRAESPSIVAGNGVEPVEPIKTAEEVYAQGRQGRIRIREDGRNTITLMKNSDASTFIHETGHDWLERLMKDGKDALAPEDLKSDVATVKKWLGVEGETVKTSQHEKFARAFERYMMEGTAPSKALASVFEQFKSWLTKIYETVNRLKAPITDDIRDVFDRLLSSKPEKTVIAPERETPKNFADHHEALAEKTTPEKAHEAAETIQTERDRLAAQHIPEMQDARLEGIAAETSRREPGSAQPDGAGNEAGSSTGEGGVDAAPGEVRKSGGQTSQEGAGSREVTSPHDELPPPETKLLDKAGNIRLDNLNLPEDVNAVIREAADRNENFIGARRGVMSDAQALDLADALGMDASTLNMRKIGQAFNAEEILAARKLLIQSATDVREAMAKAATGTDADVVAYGEAKSRHQMIQEQVAGITAEAGRALRAFRSLDGMKEAQELGALIEQSTGKTLYQLRNEAKLGMELDTPQKISKFINDSKRAAFKDMVMEFWINALLSGPMTHVKNIIGNFLVALNSVAETAGAAGVSKIRNIITGADEGVNIGEAKARLFGLMQGAQDGVLAAAKAFKNEESFTVAQTLEQRKFQSIPSAKVNVLGKEFEVGGKQVRLPGRLLTAEDEFFKAIASRQELNVIAYREATKLGLEGDAFTAKVADIVTNPTDEQMLAAKTNSEYQTFTKPLGPTGRAIQNFANSHVLAKIVVPFIRTPINLLKYAGERTALGVFSEAVRDNLSGKNGRIAQDTQISRMAMGTLVSIAVAKLVAEEMITGGGPSDSKEKATLMLTGWRPYSIKIGNMYHSYDWADPFSTTIGITADLVEAAKASTEDDAEISKVGSALLASISKNVMSKASLRGASDLTQAITDPDRYGPKYVQNLAGTVVPSIVAQAARAMDPVQREARTALDAVIARIPVLREGLFQKRDIWGEPVVSEGSLGPDMLSPIRESTINNDPVNQALVNLGVWPSKLDRKIRGVELTDQQYDDFSRVAGRMAKMRLNAVVGQAGFSSAPQAIQAQVIKATIDSSRETSRSLIMMQNPSIIKDAMDAKLEKLKGH